jgi:hypothetical protein
MPKIARQYSSFLWASSPLTPIIFSAAFSRLRGLSHLPSIRIFSAFVLDFSFDFYSTHCHQASL